MNTTTSTRPVRAATAIALGCALAITPIAVHAVEADASAKANLRQMIEADRGQSVREIQPNLRERMEADRGPVTREIQPNLRQQMEADRGPTSEVQPYNRRPIEDDRPIDPVPPPRVPLNDTDPREHRQARGASAAPDIYIHLRILALG